jgi:hypothetical protein
VPPYKTWKHNKFPFNWLLASKSSGGCAKSQFLDWLNTAFPHYLI